MRTADAAGKSGTGELRTDLEPLTKRFEALGAPEQARWMSGTLGSDRAPGPSTCWNDAVITLPESKVDELRSAYSPQAAGKAPDVVDGLRDELPSGGSPPCSPSRWWAEPSAVMRTHVVVRTRAG